MPWEIRETDGNYCVHKEGESDPLKCYPDKDAATEYMQALYASEKGLDEGAEFTHVGSTNVIVGERGPEPLYISHDRMKTWTTGNVSSLDASKSGTTITIDLPAQPVGNAPNFLWDIATRVKNALQRGNNDIIAFKVNTATRSWVGIWSNNFEDREGEIFTAKAIDDYIARVDMGITPPPELWVYHVPGTRLGQAEHVARIGAFAVAFGTFDDTPEATKAMNNLAKMKNLGMSHGYAYSPLHKKGRVYHQFNTFEVSVLPREKAANAYTSFQEINMKELNFTPDKEATVSAIWGDEWTNQLKEALLAKTEAELSRGIASKELFGDFASVSDATEPAESAKEAVEMTTKALAPLLLDVLQAQGESAELETQLIGRIKALETSYAAQMTDLKAAVERLQTAVDLKPRSAADSKETVDSKATAEDKAAFMGKKDPFWGTVVG
jgi:hypothetical protein